MVIKGGLYTNHFILYFLWVCFKSCLSELCCQSCCTPLSGNDVLSSSKSCCCGLLSLPFSSYCICAFSSFWLNPDSPSLVCAQSCTRFVSSLPRICLPQFVILVFNLPQTYHPWCDIIPGFSSFLDGWLQQLLALNTWCHLKMLLERGCRKPVLGLTEHRQMICTDSKTKEIFLVWPRCGSIPPDPSSSSLALFPSVLVSKFYILRSTKKPKCPQSKRKKNICRWKLKWIFMFSGYCTVLQIMMMELFIRWCSCSQVSDLWRSRNDHH